MESGSLNVEVWRERPGGNAVCHKRYIIISNRWSKLFFFCKWTTFSIIKVVHSVLLILGLSVRHELYYMYKCCVGVDIPPFGVPEGVSTKKPSITHCQATVIWLQGIRRFWAGPFYCGEGSTAPQGKIGGNRVKWETDVSTQRTEKRKRGEKLSLHFHWWAAIHCELHMMTTNG